MRALIQRVLQASVTVDGEKIAEIGPGLLVLFGASHQDRPNQIEKLAEKVTQLRCFSDEQGKMNLSLEDVAGAALVVSQFTLYGDCSKGPPPFFWISGYSNRCSDTLR